MKIENNKLRRANEFQKSFFAKLLEYRIIEEMELVIMAPTSPKCGYRIYKNGGRLADVKKTKVVFLADKGYKEYINRVIENTNRFYKLKTFFETVDYNSLIDDIDLKWFLNQCVKVVEKWSEAEIQTHEERKLETELIFCNRKCQKEMLIDMEFNITPWKNSCITRYGKCVIKGISQRGGRVDLVAYDANNGFGLIELKYNCKSMNNLGKHFGDFDGVKNSIKKEEIIEELIIRLDSLSSTGVYDITLDTPVKEELWFGFLLIGGDSEEDYKEEIRKSQNWKCSEIQNKKKVWVDWTDLKESCEKGTEEFMIAWYPNLNMIKIKKESFMPFLDFLR